MKATLQGKLISTTSFLKKLQRERLQTLLASIEALEEQHKSTGSTEVYQKLTQQCKTLEILETDQIKKNLIYLKQKYWHKSPKAIKLLTWRVRKRKAESMINFISTPQKGLQGKTDDILDCFKEYYSNLYTSRGPTITDIDSIFPNTSLFKTFSEQHKAMLHEAISK